MRGFSIVAVFLLAGCAEQVTTQQDQARPNYDWNDPGQRCVAMLEILADPWVNDYQKRFVMDAMRANRCAERLAL